uniref:Si:ch211-15p9.2 n=1 Tax=Sinocyclocheilus rhinocerous TaxID=307959 RepID=A0A673G580_9TELE
MSHKTFTDSDSIHKIEEAVESEQPVLPFQCYNGTSIPMTLLAQMLICTRMMTMIYKQVALSGCTVCVVHVDRKDLHVANNMGDSRAVLGVQGDDGRWSALTITNDHNAHNPDEIQRVILEHSASERKTVVKHDRLLGLLIPFRAFGDMKFKRSSVLLNRIYEARPELLIGNENTTHHQCTNSEHQSTNILGHMSRHLIADPETTYHKLRPQDKFLILATDGLWELLHRDCCAAKMLSLPQDLARMYKDDIIIVIHFNS